MRKPFDPAADPSASGVLIPATEMPFGRTGVTPKDKLTTIKLQRLRCVFRDLETESPPKIAEGLTRDVFWNTHFRRSVLFESKFSMHPKKLLLDPFRDSILRGDRRSMDH